jgi:hypothetical protein
MGADRQQPADEVAADSLLALLRVEGLNDLVCVAAEHVPHDLPAVVFVDVVEVHAALDESRVVRRDRTLERRSPGRVGRVGSHARKERGQRIVDGLPRGRLIHAESRGDVADRKA